jgi:tRNA 2-thiouridine synthesizing protein E
MTSFTHDDRAYDVDSSGFLLDPRSWDEGFATGMAAKLKIPEGLRDEHWKVLRFIRSTFELTGRCPLIYETCCANNLTLGGLRRLFPPGYLRGACRLAGVTYRDGVGMYSPTAASELPPPVADKAYRIDARGFLIDPSEWDEDFARRRAEDLKMRGGLSDRHWNVLRFLRERYAATGVVPTVYETCEAQGFELDVLESLFPDGYHRGAVRLAGLRVR